MISIHALLAESDGRAFLARPFLLQFLSTLSLRRATIHQGQHTEFYGHFYPRSPCGERPVQVIVVVMYALFLSTLSLRRATRRGVILSLNTQFLSTLSLRRATTPTSYWRRQKLFLSTLSLRRATFIVDGHRVHITHFYPRSPCGERPYGRINDISRLIFLSTLSLRRATTIYMRSISRHLNFYPRSPCGERPSKRCAETGKR